MRVAVTASPVMAQSGSGGMTTLNLSFMHHVEQAEYVRKFNYWEHRLEDFDIVHHFGLGNENLPWFRKVKEHGLKLMVTPMWWGESFRKFVASRVPVQNTHRNIREMLQLTDMLLPNSQGELCGLAATYGVGEYQIVPCAVDDTLLDHSRYKMSGFPAYLPAYTYALCLGRFDPRQKNQMALVRACPKTEILFVGPIGDGRYYNECYNARTLGWHTFCHDVTHTSAINLISRASVVIIPSLYEYPSLVAMEALTLGVNVAITTGGSTQEVFGDTVEYLNPRSEVSIHKAVHRALDRPPPLAIGKDRFTWSKSAGPLLNRAVRRINGTD